MRYRIDFIIILILAFTFYLFRARLITMAMGLTARQRRHLQRKSARPEVSMTAGTNLRCRFEPLTSDEIIKIHRAALQLLSEVGMADPTPRVLDTALVGGCRLSGEGRLLFPRSLVEDMLASAAKEFTVCGRDPQFDFQARNGTVNFCTGGAAVTMLDIESRSYRPSTLRDIYDLARVCDCLENIQWFTRPVVATDIEDSFELDANTVYACAAGTAKHIATSFSKGEHLYRIKPLLDLLAGGDGKYADRPFCTAHATTVVSPMTFAADSLEVACAAVDMGMPIQCQTGPQAGATAPAALAGTVVQGCAESLASLSVINMLKPGHPVVLGNWLFVSDLRTGAFSGGGPEQALLGAASGQMSAYYGIPGGLGAGMTDAKLPDYQSGFEKAISLTLAALSGGGLVYESVGMLGSLLGSSFESMVIDDELLSFVRRVGRGIEVTEDTLSVDTVRDAVFNAGHYLGHEQTIDLMETEYEYPKFADRQSPEDWWRTGAADMLTRAAESAKHLLHTHHPSHIDGAVDDMIRQNFPIRLVRLDPSKLAAFAN